MSNDEHNFFHEILYYLKTYKRWWLTPIVIIFVLFGILVVVAEVAPVISPFIYTLF